MSAQPVIDAALLEGIHHRAFLYFLECLGVGDHLDEAAPMARLQTSKREHIQVKVLCEPKLIHHVYELQHEHVLTQIVAYLVDGVEAVGSGVHIFENKLQWHRE